MSFEHRTMAAAPSPWGDEAPWKRSCTAAREGNAVLTVRFPSHVPEIFDALVEHALGLEQTVHRLEEALQAGVSMLLSHSVSRLTYRQVPDLVRYIDERLPGVKGLVLCIDDDVEVLEQRDFHAFMHAARAVAAARGVGFQPDETMATRVECPPLAPAARQTEPAGFLPEPLMVYPRPDSLESTLSTLNALLEPLGTIMRFVNRGDLALPHGLLRRYIENDSRDKKRLCVMTDSDTGHALTVLRTAIVIPLRRRQDGTLSVPDMSLVQAVCELVADAGARPHLVVGHEPDDRDHETMQRLQAIAETLVIPLYPVNRADVRQGQTAERPMVFESVVHLSELGDERLVGAVEQTGGLLDEARREAWLAALEGVWTHRVSRDETHMSTWLGELCPEPWVAPSVDGVLIDIVRCFHADLWLMDATHLGLWVASTDPAPMDALLEHIGGAETQDSVSWLRAAKDRGHPYVLDEGRLPGGRLPPALVQRPPKSVRKTSGKPLTILGIASTTLQNHSACLVRDGKVVGAVQEERFCRRKQAGWHPPGRPGVTVVADPAIPLENAYPKRAIESVLGMAGITMDEVDVVALNGIPARYFPTYSLSEPSQPPCTIFDGRTMFVPHHLSHAASAYRVSGMDEETVVFTVDGRGERETAAFFDVHQGALNRTFDVLVHEDSLIGGVYEYITTILGFGHYGQGSTMGLAAMGEPSIDMSSFLSARNRDDYRIHDSGIIEAFGQLVRKRDGLLSSEHLALAASVQQAVEDTVIRFIEDGLGGRPLKQLCLAGGVALNCSMNQRLRQHFGMDSVFVQPAAHDAGTSLGAALEAHWEITGEAAPWEMSHAYLGPQFDDGQIEAVLKAFRLPYQAPSNLTRDVAELIADGQIVCWFQGRMEFGPRALGARSILADPRRDALKARLNFMKGRQWWRPFGPSVLSGREGEYFEDAFHSPFMLFTLPVRPDKQDQIPVVVHSDGSSRPQSVNSTENPLYYALIEAFERHTGLPMLVNTSFNTAHEPIVCTPMDAVGSFLQLGADHLAIGPYLVSRAEIERRGTR